MAIALGPFQGGQLAYLDEAKGQHELSAVSQWGQFDGRLPRGAHPHQGERYSLIIFRYSAADDADREGSPYQRLLEALGFPAHGISQQTGATHVWHPQVAQWQDETAGLVICGCYIYSGPTGRSSVRSELAEICSTDGITLQREEYDLLSERPADLLDDRTWSH